MDVIREPGDMTGDASERAHLLRRTSPSVQGMLSFPVEASADDSPVPTNTSSAPIHRAHQDEFFQPAAQPPQAEHQTGCWRVCDPHSRAHRFAMLGLLQLLTFGSYFCYDNPAALQPEMIKQLELTYSGYTALYAWYSWPNVFLCLVGGFLIDRVLGVRLAALIFSTLVCAGQAVFATGAYWAQPTLLYAGRFLFGVGAESLGVAANAYVVKWFSGRELSLVFGVLLSIARVGSTANMNSMGPLFHYLADECPWTARMSGQQVLGITLFIAGLVCVSSWLCAAAMVYFDARADRILERTQVPLPLFPVLFPLPIHPSQVPFPIHLPLSLPSIHPHSRMSYSFWTDPLALPCHAYSPPPTFLLVNRFGEIENVHFYAIEWTWLDIAFINFTIIPRLGMQFL